MFEKKTKIVCTIGPASWDPVVLEQLAGAGMDVARLNFSHGTHEEKKEQIENIRKISEKLDKHIAVMVDLQGPKIRLGKIEGELTEGERDPKHYLKRCDKIKISIEPKDKELPIQYDLSPFMKPGQRILFNDGLVEGKVASIRGKTLEIEIINDGYISSNKGVNVPETLLPGASLTSKDIADAEYALKAGIEYLAISFVQTLEDVEKAQNLIKKYAPQTKLVVKLEKPQAIENLEAIIQATDAVMVARGDLAIETKASQVPIIQQEIIRLSRQHQKPVIVATQMLESMIENPRPTRAEVSDVANAVLHEVDGVMLSGESANGKYPVQAVQTMTEVIKSVESNPAYKRYIKIDWEHITRKAVGLNAIVSSAASLAYRINAKFIVVATASGRTVRLISSFRPTSNILAVTHDIDVSNQLALVWGIDAIEVQPSDSPDDFSKHIMRKLKSLDLLKKGDEVVMVIGTHIGTSGDTDTIKVITA